MVNGGGNVALRAPEQDNVVRLGDQRGSALLQVRVYVDHVILERANRARVRIENDL